MLIQSTTQDAELKQVTECYGHITALAKAHDKAAERQADYVALLNAIKGDSNKVKMLAAQSIPRFFKYFSSLGDQAINAQLDLCEEEDIQIRAHAIKGLPLLCKDNRENVHKIADVLSQLLYVEDQLELDTVKRALVEMLRIDIKATLGPLFNQIRDADDVLREKAISFIREKVMQLGDELIFNKPDVEQCISENIKKHVAAEISESDFKSFMDILLRLKMYGGENRAQLVEVVHAQAEAGLPEGDSKLEVAFLEKLLACIHTAVSLYKPGSNNSVLFTILSTRVLPFFSEFSEFHRLPILKALAELAPFVNATDARAALPTIYSMLRDNLPTPSISSEPGNVAVGSMPEINFSYVECLMYSFLRLAFKVPGALNTICGIKIVTGQPQDRSEEDHSDKLKDLMDRLKTMTQQLDVYKKGLQPLVSKPVSQLTAEEKPKRAQAEIALQLTTNVIIMSQMLQKQTKDNKHFLNPQQSEAALHLSWKKGGQQQHVGQKRPASQQTSSNGAATAGTAAKRSRSEATANVVQPSPRPGASTSTASRGGRSGRGGDGRRFRR